jgi:hypothetical protein
VRGAAAIGAVSAAFVLLVGAIVWRSHLRAVDTVAIQEAERTTARDGDKEVRIYKRNPVPEAVIASVFIPVVAWAASFIDVRGSIVCALVLAVLICGPISLEFRRKIVISAQGFQYKWRSGNVTAVNAEDMAKVEESRMPYHMFLGRPTVVPGLRVSLKSGEVHTLPLDFPDRADIAARLRAMVSSTPSKR